MRWIPKLVLDGSEDARELGIGMQDVALAKEPEQGPESRSRAWWAGALDRLRSLGRPRTGR